MKGLDEPTQHSAFRIPLVVLHFFSALIVLSYLTSLTSLPLALSSTSPSCSRPFDASHTPPSEAVSAEANLIPFIDTEALNVLHETNESVQAWKDLYRGSDGFLWVQRNRSDPFLVQKYLGRHGAEAWGVSMFHGLHCLGMIRQMMIMEISKTEYENRGHAERRDTEHEGHEHMIDKEHVGHCFGYLAQALLCTGDTTIEPPIFQYDNQGMVTDVRVDGELVKHQCRNTDQAFEVLRKSRDAGVQDWIREAWQPGATVEDLFP